MFQADNFYASLKAFAGMKFVSSVSSFSASLGSPFSLIRKMFVRRKCCIYGHLPFSRISIVELN